MLLVLTFSRNNLFYYKRKLDVYNLSFYGLGDASVNCFMWDQTTGKRGADEVGSCIIHHLRAKAAEGCKAAVLYSDNCSGQNQNRFLLAALTYLIQHTPLERVALCFLS